MGPLFTDWSAHLHRAQSYLAAGSKLFVMASPWSIATPVIRWVKWRASDSYLVCQICLDLPRFTGGLVGYFGYDTVRFVEPRLAKDCAPR